VLKIRKNIERKLQGHEVGKLYPLDTHSRFGFRLDASFDVSVPGTERFSLKVAEALQVRDMMTKDLKTLKRHDKLPLADDVMQLGHICHLPVLDDDYLNF